MLVLIQGTKDVAKGDSSQYFTAVYLEPPVRTANPLLMSKASFTCLMSAVAQRQNRIMMHTLDRGKSGM